MIWNLYFGFHFPADLFLESQFWLKDHTGSHTLLVIHIVQSRQFDTFNRKVVSIDLAVNVTLTPIRFKDSFWSL